MLAAYLLAKGTLLEIVLPNFFISNDRELSNIVMPIWTDPYFAGVETHGGSFWIKIH